MNIGVEKVDLASEFRYLQFKGNSTAIGSQPIIVYLHGAGEFGLNIQQVCKYGLPFLLKNERLKSSCDVVCPQMEQDAQWESNRLQKLISSLGNQGHEVILVGYSRGGKAVCDYVARFGTNIGLAIVIAGRGNEKIISKLKSLDLVSILGIDDPWPDMDQFLKDAETHCASVTDIRLKNKGHYISEEIFLTGKLHSILSSHQVVLESIPNNNS